MIRPDVHFYLTVAVLSILCPIGCARNSEVYVSDRFGNVVFKNGTVSYVRPVPVGNRSYTTDLNYNRGKLTMLYGFARSFVRDVQPNKFPFDIAGRIAANDFSLEDDYPEIIRHFSGIAACVVIGVAFTVAFVIGGCAFCCCRCCCGNCGGDGSQEYSENEDCTRMGLSQALFLMSACMLSAAVCVIITDNSFTDTVDFANRSLSTNIDDIGIFLENTGEEFQYLVTDMYDVIHESFQKDIANMGEVTRDSIYVDLNVGQLLDNAVALDVGVSKVSVLLDQTVNDVSDLETTATSLATALFTLADNIDGTVATCDSNCSPNRCGNIDTKAMRNSALDASMLPDLSSTQTQFNGLKSTNFTLIVENNIKDWDRMAVTIDDFSSTVKEGLNTSLMAYYDLIHGLSDGIFQDMKTAFPSKSAKEATSDIFETVKYYDKYRQYFGMALTAVFILIIAILVIGMFMGVVGHNPSALPTERGNLSHCGGNMLLGGIFVMFLVVTLLMILTAVTFLFGSLLIKGCEPFEDLTIFRDFLDQGKVPQFSLARYQLGKTIQDAGLELKGYDVLLSCRADETPWTALKIGEVVPLEEALKYLNYIGDIGQIASEIATSGIDLGSFTLATREFQNRLNDLDSTGVATIDFEGIISIASQPSVSIDLPSILAEMRTIESVCQGVTQTSWRDHISALESIQQQEVMAVNNASSSLSKSVTTLQLEVEALMSLKVSTLNLARSIDFQVQNNVTGVLTQASFGVVGKIFTALDDYASEVVYLIYNNLGNCQPLWNIYDFVIVTVCDYGVDSLNGYWFSTGWGLFFFLPIVIVAAKLSKHYKIMEETVGYDDLDEMINPDDNNLNYYENKGHLQQSGPDTGLSPSNNGSGGDAKSS